MSTSTIVVSSLKQLDHRVAVEEKRLPWYRRFSRRYLSGRAAVTFFIAKHYGMAEGVVFASPIKASTVALMAKVPFLAVGWEHAVALFEGVVSVGSASH
jgi:hypothetical protein